jgi:hypothetical protein
MAAGFRYPPGTSIKLQRTFRLNQKYTQFPETLLPESAKHSLAMIVRNVMKSTKVEP